MAFKIKTTSPEKFKVKPSMGVIRPGGHAEVAIYLSSKRQNRLADPKTFPIALSARPSARSSATPSEKASRNSDSRLDRVSGLSSLSSLQEGNTISLWRNS